MDRTTGAIDLDMSHLSTDTRRRGPAAQLVIVGIRRGGNPKGGANPYQLKGNDPTALTCACQRSPKTAWLDWEGSGAQSGNFD